MSRSILLLVVLAFSCAFATAAIAQQNEIFTVVLREGQNIRDMARIYLNDPDLWPEILRESEATSISEIVPGTTLRIPLTQVSRAIREINRSTVAIQQATSVGARLFASDIISQSIESQNEALQHRQSSQWEDCYTSANTSVVQAEQASDISLQARDMSAEAVLTDRYGNVESRKTGELVWNDRRLKDILIERERVRTLSSSLAEITFRNESKFRLDANTNVEILTMRVDLLNNQEETSVSLVEGDVYALLRGGGKKKKFDVSVSGVETDIESNNFWASLEDDGARFANYDSNALRVTSGGETVTLGMNQGTLVRGRQRPRAPRALLAAPALVSPVDDRVLYSDNIVLSWTAVENAVGYWLEIALDQEFSQRVQSEWNVVDTRLDLNNLEDGRYYWRVAAVDDMGFPGLRSLTWKIVIRNDTQAPYLVCLQPETNKIVRTDRITIVGETETGASVTANGDTVQVTTDATFETTVRLNEGQNEIVLLTRDVAGLTSELSRTVTYSPDRPLTIEYDTSIPTAAPRHFLSRSLVFTLSGRVLPRNRVEISNGSGDVVVGAYADDAGVFSLNIPTDGQEQDYAIRVTSASGFVTEDQIIVTYDAEPPVLRLAEPTPAYVAAPQITISGIVTGGDLLTINGRDVPLSGDQFSMDIPLIPGLNTITMVAGDSAGNTTLVERQVQYDRDPPAVIRSTVSAQRATGGETIEIKVFVTDTSYLRRAATVSLTVGVDVYRGYLTYQPSTGSYRGLLQLPLTASGPIRLSDVEILDVFNHRVRYAR